MVTTAVLGILPEAGMVTTYNRGATGFVPKDRQRYSEGDDRRGRRLPRIPLVTTNRPPE